MTVNKWAWLKILRAYSSTPLPKILATPLQCPHIKELSQSIELLKLSLKEKEQLPISYEAFVLNEQISSGNQREANLRNGDIVSESDDPDTIHNSQTPLDPGLKKLIEKRRRSIRRQAQRTKAKRIMQKNFLGRKVAKRIDTIVEKYPDIGETIEHFVRDNNVGAEAWRRTGILTFDGNVKKKQKATYERIRKHLESIYKRKCSYGTTVQLCIARNKRHRSALRYKGI